MFIDSQNGSSGAKWASQLTRFCSSAAFPHSYPGSVSSVEWLHIQVGMERLLQLPLTSTHNETKGQERRGSFWKPLQKVEEGLFQFLSLLSLSLFSKAILLKQGFKSNHDYCSKPSGVSHLTLYKSQSPSQTCRAQQVMAKHHIFVFLSYSCPLCQLCSSHTGFLAVPQTH